MEVEALRLLIREKLQDGRLSHEQISRVQSRPANGQKCDACEKLITTAQFVVTGTTLAGRGSIQLHVQCFQLWDDERCARESSPPSHSLGTPAHAPNEPRATSSHPGLVTRSARHRFRSRGVGPTVASSTFTSRRSLITPGCMGVSQGPQAPTVGAAPAQSWRSQAPLAREQY
jgi:hypothetical protein